MRKFYSPSLVFAIEMLLKRVEVPEPLLMNDMQRIYSTIMFLMETSVFLQEMCIFTGKRYFSIFEGVIRSFCLFYALMDESNGIISIFVEELLFMEKRESGKEKANYYSFEN